MTFNPFVERIARVSVSTNRVDKTGKTTSESYSWMQNRMSISCSLGGGAFGNALVRIAGVPLDLMQRIARLQFDPNFLSSTDVVAVDVWDDVAQGYSAFYQGLIVYPSVSMNPPEAWLTIEAVSGGQLFNVGDAPAFSDPGPVALTSILTTLAGYGGFVLDFSPLATDYPCVNLHLSGSPLAQIGQVIAQFPDLDFAPILQRLRVWPKAKTFADESLRIATDNGLVGYPSYSTSGLTFRTLFNPALMPGRAINLETGLQFVDRTNWSCAVVNHVIEPNMPGGQWFSSVVATPFGVREQQ